MPGHPPLPQDRLCSPSVPHNRRAGFCGVFDFPGPLPWLRPHGAALHLVREGPGALEDGERGPWKGPDADAEPSPKTWAQTDALPSQAVPREGGGLWGLDTLQEESTRDLPPTFS